MNKIYLFLPIVALIIVSVGALLVDNESEILQAYFYYTNGQDGGSYRNESAGEVTLAVNYGDSFNKVRSKNSFLVSPSNFLAESGSTSCPNYKRGPGVSEYFNYNVTVDNSRAVISMSGYLNQCIRDQNLVFYAPPRGISSAINYTYRYSITDYDNLGVVERLDCRAFESQGKKIIQFAARLENRDINNYEERFESSCILSGLPPGEYTLQYYPGWVNQMIAV